MNVLITGTSSGIGRATANLFLANGFDVYGLDIKQATIIHQRYNHRVCDVSFKSDLPDIEEKPGRPLTMHYIVNNAGVIDEETAIKVNLEGYINVVEKYASASTISIVNVASISGHVGLDTARYAASQGGRLAYTKHLAIELGKKWGIRVNSISPGAVMSGLEPELYKHKMLVDAVANENILKKWIQPSEIAEWIYFVSVVNKSMTGQDILIDNGEVANYNFVSVYDE